MKRRELQALCAEHGLAAHGSKADLAGALSVRTHTRNRAPLEKKNSLQSRGVWSTPNRRQLLEEMFHRLTGIFFRGCLHGLTGKSK
jgi:hypothetical protein